MAYDINKLRQQAIFSQIPDMSGGTLSMGGDMGQQQIPFQTEEVPDPDANIPPKFRIPQVPTFERSPAPDPESISTKGYTPADLIGLMNQAYTPETTSRDRFNRLLDNMPERNNPSWARKLVAGGMGIGAKDPAQAIGVMEGAMYAPYNRDMSEWKEKTGPYQAAMQAENTANINERQLTGNLLTTSVNAQRYADMDKNAQERNRISEIRAKAYALVNNGYKVMQAGDRIVAVRASPYDRIDLGDSGGMDRSEELKAINAGRVEASKVQGENAARNVIAAGGAMYRDEEGNIYYGNPRDPKDMSLTPGPNSPPRPVGAVTTVGTQPPREETGKEIDARQQREWRKIYDTNPKYQKFFKGGQPGGRLVLGPEPTDTWLPFDEPSAEDIADYQALKQLLYPGSAPGKTTPPPPPQAPVKPTSKLPEGPNKNIFGSEAPTYGGPGGVSGNIPQGTRGEKSSTGAYAPPGRVVVQDASGKKFTLPAGQLLAFLKANPTFKQVQ